MTTTDARKRNHDREDQAMNDLKAIREEAVTTSNVLADILDLLDERLTSNPRGRPGDLSASEAEPAPEGGGDPGAMRDSDLDAIRDRVDRNSFPQGDRARLLAEVDRLRAIITGQIDAARREWLEEGDTDALARAEHWRNLLDPTEGES